MWNKLKPGNLFFKLLGAHLLVVVITLLAVSLVFSYLAEEYFFSTREWELASQAEKVAEVLEEELRLENHEQVEKMASALAVSMNLKIRVIDAMEGRRGEQIISVAPIEEEEETQLGLEQREVEYVLQGNSYSKKVFGPEMQRLLVALPVFQEEDGEGDSGNPADVIGVITVSAPLTGVQATVAHLSRLTTYSGLIAAAVAGVLALSLSKTISNPLRVMTRAARELVGGNFRSRINVTATGEMGELAATFNQAVDEMEKTVEEQKRLQELRQNLVANVSHEFRVPLTSIQGFAEAMLDGLVEEEEKEKCLRLILDNTFYVKRLVSDLLELSSIESGHIQLQWEKISTSRLMDRVIHSAQPKAKGKNISLEYEQKHLPSYVEADEDRLFQVLINLLENALTYTPPGGQIKVEAREVEDNIVFMVRDSGAGIPAEDLPHIWERFYKVDKARNRAHKGKGLGLAITKELVHLHGGEVSVESAPGKGSTFYVYLPQQQDEKA